MDDNLIFALALAGLSSGKTANERIDNLPKPMVYAGTLGQGGTITTLPTASADNKGDTYVVITDGTYSGQVANVGDMFISMGTAWTYVPSGDIDTWRNIKVNGTEILGTADKDALDLVKGDNINLSVNDGVVTISVTGMPTKTSDLTNDSDFVTNQINDATTSSETAWSSEKTSYEINRRISTVYGFHIDSSDDDADDCVIYLEDAVGMTPAYMDYANDKFVYGSWENAFFMPKPCMLKSDGTVAYYLDKNDYSKKEDGTASDVADDTFDGNAMMEWGKIWYKIVPDANDTASASVYISDRNIDGTYHCWSNMDDNGNVKEHFYTPIYNGSIVNDGTNDVLRSISGKTYDKLCQSKTATVERQMAQRNGTGWDSEVYCDYVLMSLLLVLISKSLDTSSKFGNGRTGQSSSASNMLSTGAMDDKGLFWGSNTGDYGVKVFGMENQWGNQWRRLCGLILDTNVWKYKLTKSTADGSTVSDYNTDGTGYLTNNDTAPVSNYCRKMTFTNNGAFYDKETSSSSTVGYKDYFYVNASSQRYAFRGGRCTTAATVCGTFYLDLDDGAAGTAWSIGASVSYK